MLQIGRVQSLQVVKIKPHYAMLAGDDQHQAPLPIDELPDECNEGDRIDAFVYLDSEDRLAATTCEPKAQLGEVAWLKVVAVHHIGAFLDLGIPKDIFVAEREQFEPMQVGHSYAVYIYLDNLGRLAATPRLEEQLKEYSDYHYGDKVEGLISARSQLGYQVVIDNRYLGMLYHNEVFSRLTIGQTISAYVQKNREDGRLDLRLNKPGDYRLDALQQQIMDQLKQDGGYIALSDKSDPKLIAAVFGVSKGQYKKAIGHLYRQHLIQISSNGILLNQDKNKQENS
ncbi:MAG: Conserved virulence factor B [Candidatus Celerinatantimonas neptuna]|nr:MAG: Conserved virulence factor B [Candidatus Celerinatantimonas neptuna]